MFSEMVQRSEQLFFSPVESTDDRLFHLPAFLEALASIVGQMDEVVIIAHSWPLMTLTRFICCEGGGGGGAGTETTVITEYERDSTPGYRHVLGAP